MKDFVEIASAPGAPLELVPGGASASDVVDQQARLRQVLSAKCVFLSASENIERDPDPGSHRALELSLIPAPLKASMAKAKRGWADALMTNIRDNRHPRRVERAISWVCREAFARGYTVVFGGHPAVSPFVLEVARRHCAQADEIRVVIFQSAFFSAHTQASTDIARWTNGCMLVTKSENGSNEREARVNSLTLMRRHMAAVVGIRAGIFIGGMSGLLEESAVLGRKPKYAVGSTGGTAAFLLDNFGQEHGGRGGGLGNALQSERSYGVVARRILDDLESSMDGAV